MRICSLQAGARRFFGVRRPDGFVDLSALAPGLPDDLAALLRSPQWNPAALAQLAADVAPAALLPVERVAYRPLLSETSKILCLGLNFLDHAAEAAQRRPEHPVVFARFPSGFVGHEQPLLLPKVSTHFDYEAELVVVIGKRGRYIAAGDALDHVAGYTLMNDGTIRDYQTRTHQWTIGKNFDATGALGPELVTADELPRGARGLTLRGSLNGRVLQEASTDDMVFGVEAAIASISEAMTLEPGDLIAMGTPGGVGFVRQPPIFLTPGDVFEVEVSSLGVLRNRVAAE
jgi:acylpyruvate hydrolase